MFAYALGQVEPPMVGIHLLWTGPQAWFYSPCGVPELGHQSWPGLLGDSLVFADKAAKDGPTLDSLLGEVGGRVVGPGWAETRTGLSI
jgi:hypothetical protein